MSRWALPCPPGAGTLTERKRFPAEEATQEWSAVAMAEQVQGTSAVTQETGHRALAFGLLTLVAYFSFALGRRARSDTTMAEPAPAPPQAAALETGRGRRAAV